MTHAPKHEVAFGNPEVVALLENWLRRAERGKLNHVALIVCQAPNLAACDFAGAQEMDPVVMSAIEQLKKQVELRVTNRDLPSLNPELGADHVCYDMACGPLTFDFFTWLVEAEMKRVRAKAPYPLKVHFFKGKDGKSGVEPSRLRLFEKLVRPAMDLFGAVQSTVPGGGTQIVYGLCNIVAMAKQGESTPKYRLSEKALATIAGKCKEPFVTITLREASTSLHRNSNVDAWLRFAEDLRAQGKRVIFLRDTEKAHEPLLLAETYPEASIDLALRAALYSRAEHNFFVSNGPVGLAYYGDRPWTMFVALYEGDRYKPGTPQGFEESMGIKVGEQLPWSGPQQRIVYAEDSYENLCASWKSLREGR